MSLHKKYDRRSFLLQTALAGAGVALLSSVTPASAFHQQRQSLSSLATKRIGIIGLDTSHSEVFTRLINEGEFKGPYRVVAAYPHGSKDIPEALEMKPGIIAAVKAMGVEIVDSIEELLKRVDVVLLESIDGRPHLEQALPVLKAGKRMFIDKPLAADLADAKRLFEASRQYNSPIFTSSALRFDPSVQRVAKGAIGRVTGADVYSPAVIEPHHMDLAWYGIHGVEMLFTVMGRGCKEVRRVYEQGTDLVVGVWDDGRIGTVRGIREGASNIAGTAFGETGIAALGPFASYNPLVEEILSFFETGVVPVTEQETLEIFRFMHAADISRRRKGKRVAI